MNQLTITTSRASCASIGRPKASICEAQRLQIGTNKTWSWSRLMMSYNRDLSLIRSTAASQQKNTENCLRRPKSSQVRATFRSRFGFEMS